MPGLVLIDKTVQLRRRQREAPVLNQTATGA
jgi:hypothetical protein